ncbi:MAG: hypothetical protein ACI8UO_004430 [Verrucomicrobiales bacterium]|jgi:hypothetical protein
MLFVLFFGLVSVIVVIAAGSGHESKKGNGKKDSKLGEDGFH